MFPSTHQTYMNRLHTPTTIYYPVILATHCITEKIGYKTYWQFYDCRISNDGNKPSGGDVQDVRCRTSGAERTSILDVIEIRRDTTIIETPLTNRTDVQIGQSLVNLGQCKLNMVNVCQTYVCTFYVKASPDTIPYKIYCSPAPAGVDLDNKISLWVREVICMLT